MVKIFLILFLLFPTTSLLANDCENAYNQCISDANSNSEIESKCTNCEYYLTTSDCHDSTFITDPPTSKIYRLKSVDKKLEACFQYLRSLGNICSDEELSNCDCADGYIKKSNFEKCVEIVVCEDENAESIDNMPCTCKEGFTQDDETKKCVIKAVLNEAKCEEGYTLNAYNECIKITPDLDPLNSEGGGCSLKTNAFEILNLFILLAGMIPAIRRKK